MTIDLPKLIEDHERRRLKSATAQAVKLCGVADFAQRSRVTGGSLSKYGNENDIGDHFIPLDVALELDRHNGAPLLLSAAAGVLGYRLVSANDSEDAELQLADAQAIAKETGDVVNLLLSLLTSGKRIDAADRLQVLREITEAKAALYRLSAKIGGRS